MTQIENLKADLISQIDKRLEDKIIEPTNAELLKKLILNAETINEAMMIAELGTTYKRTGFHFDKRLEKLGSDIKYLKKNEDLSFKTDSESISHKLIIGDNYDALQQLLITHRGIVDVIYIDPPYGCNDMGEFAKTNYTNGITRDNLLSMLYPRLQLARQLLSEEGVIFCSIDDKNQAYVKGLFDEVFGEENFVCNFVWLNSSSNINDAEIKINGANAGNFKSGYEYILTYSKNKLLFSFNLKKTNEKYLKREITKNGNAISSFLLPKGTVIDTKMTKTFSGSINGNVEKIILKENDLIIIDGVIQKDVVLEGPFGNRNIWIEKLLKNENVYDSKGQKIINIDFTQSGGFRIVKEKHGEIITNVISSVGSVQNENRHLNNIGVTFTFPKPYLLIKYLLSICTNNSSIILDFFAGSGTTGQAVLELNREDDGNRQFILCTNNEATDMNPNGIAYDVTSKRLKRVMTGKCYDGTNDFPWAQKNDPYGDNLDVYEIESVNNAEQKQGKTPFDLIDESCYDMDPFKSVQEKITWVCNNFEHTQKYIEEES